MNLAKFCENREILSRKQFLSKRYILNNFLVLFIISGKAIFHNIFWLGRLFLARSHS